MMADHEKAARRPRTQFQLLGIMNRRSSWLSLPVLLVTALLTPSSTTASTAAGTAAPEKNSPAAAARTKGLAGAYLSGRHAEANADNRTATAYFNRALQLDPDNQGLLRQTYFLAAQVGDFTTAIPAAKRSYEAAPQLALAPLIVMIGHYQKQEYDRAWAYLEKISTQSPVGFALPMLRAWGLAPRQSADAALAELAPLQGPNGAIDLYNVMAGMLNEYHGRGPQALVHYKALADRIEQQPLSIMRLVAAGYTRLGKGDEVKGLIARFQDTRGASPLTDGYLDAFADPRRQPRKVTPSEGMAEALFAAAQLLLQNANTAFSAQLAVVYGQASLYLNPDLTIARRVIGATLAGRNRFEESNAILSTIKKAEPGYLAVQMQMAENLERMDRSQEALTLLQTIVKEQPNWPEAHIAVGDHMRRMKNFTAAVESYDRAFKLYPKGEPDNWQLYYARGIALERIKSWDRADKDFRKAIALNPEDAGLLNYLGYSLIDRGVNVQEGRALIEKAFKLKPDDGYIIDSLGWAMFLMGQYEDAVVHLEKAVETNPSDPTINEHLGDAYWKVGRRNEALFQWRRALTLEPEDTQRTAIQDKLAQGLARN
jgi:tetratricopeptide (TPR) repeat protein